MKSSGLIRKARVARRVFRGEGVVGVLLLGTRFIEKNLMRFSRGNGDHKLPVGVKAKYLDVRSTDFSSRKHTWSGTNAKKLTLNWLMPPPGKGSGGHFTIFRFIKSLESAGHTCRIYLYTEGSPGRVADVESLMGNSFPKVKATMHWLGSSDEIADADGIFATSWETAYASFVSNAAGKRFYFVQDFEPYFYPVGSLSILAENTYKFGFYGITAGGWLAKKLNNDYGMSTNYFNFGSDSSTYRYENTNSRKEILAYVRPYTERRGFELAVLALDIFHQAHPEYTINLFGWDVSSYDIPFPYHNLGVLEHSECNQLYNRCAAALVLSLTNMSLLPLELLSSGCIPVVNEGENNRLVSDNPYIAYCPADPMSLAKTLSQTVTRKRLTAYANEASRSVQNASWEDSGSHFVSIVEREIRKAD